MLLIYQVPGKKIGTIKLTGGRLEISDESNGLLPELVNSMRKGLSDEVLYAGLMRRFNGRFYAVEQLDQEALDILEDELTPLLGANSSAASSKKTKPLKDYPLDESKLEAFKRKFSND